MGFRGGDSLTLQMVAGGGVQDWDSLTLRLVAGGVHVRDDLTYTLVAGGVIAGTT